MIKKLFVLILGVMLIVSLSGVVFAAGMNENQLDFKISPSVAISVVADLYKDVLPDDFRLNTQGRSLLFNSSEVIGYIEKERSLNINIPNIDVGKIKDTNPLGSTEIQFLKEHGYTDNQIYFMDVEMFRGIESRWLLSKEAIENIKFLYNELANTVLEHWTIGDFVEYSKTADANSNVYAPTEEEVRELRDRNITLDDAKLLLKDFYSYATVLQQTDELIKEYLRNYYMFSLENIYNLAVVEQEMNAYRRTYSCSLTASLALVGVKPEGFLVAAPPTGLQGTTYRWVSNFPGYGADWFHQSSDCHMTFVLPGFASAVLKGYNCLYDETGNAYAATNLYGTWSVSQEGAHEGIDYVHVTHSVNPNIYSIASGEVIGRNSNNGFLIIYGQPNNGLDISYFYGHMNSFSVSIGDIIDTNDGVGVQGNMGNATGSHVHFAVEWGRTVYTSYENDDSLDSMNPYGYIHYFLQ